MIESAIEMRETAYKGRGIFAAEHIGKGKIIESAPVIVMSMNDRIILEETKLSNYIFEWGEDEKQCCMALGYVALYNHSYKSNCEYEMDYEKETITVKTVRDIMKGEELTINYNGDWNSRKKVWFDVK